MRHTHTQTAATADWQEEIAARAAHTAAMREACATYDAAKAHEQECLARMHELAATGRPEAFAEASRAYNAATRAAIAALFDLSESIGPEWRARLAKFDHGE